MLKPVVENRVHKNTVFGIGEWVDRRAHSLRSLLPPDAAALRRHVAGALLTFSLYDREIRSAELGGSLLENEPQNVPARFNPPTSARYASIRPGVGTQDEQLTLAHDFSRDLDGLGDQVQNLFVDRASTA